MKRKKKNEPKRRKLTEFLTNAEELLAEMMKRKPANAEGKWLFSIIRDDPESPTWYERLNLYASSYEKAAEQCVALASTLPPRSIHRIEVRRGEEALRLLADGMRSEARYRQERNAQPNN